MEGVAALTPPDLSRDSRLVTSPVLARRNSSGAMYRHSSSEDGAIGSRLLFKERLPWSRFGSDRQAHALTQRVPSWGG